LKKLHPTQLKLIELLKTHLEEPLTIREIQDELNLSSTSVVHHHLTQLEKKGYLKRNPSNPSDFQIISDTEKKLIYLSLYGLAECGPNGLFLDGSPIDRIPISTKILNFPLNDAFLVKANGDSMLPKIQSGDLVVAVKSKDAQNGTVVVCVNEGKALIKKFIKKSNEILLESFNPDFKTIIANKENFFIEGIVKSILSYSI
jgi:repressor LexA